MAHRFWYSSRQRHSGSTCFDSVFVGALTEYMGAVGQGSPREIFEVVPLFQEVVAAVVAYLPKQRSMDHTDLMEVGGIDDEFAIRGQYRLRMV